ncbi:hypothetical protein JXD20_00380 [Candidatus Peregrinibacteria bacterium]|nr:hypothetical protein [Candidatus Peregrinibacteria bacterium]
MPESPSQRPSDRPERKVIDVETPGAHASPKALKSAYPECFEINVILKHLEADLANCQPHFSDDKMLQEKGQKAIQELIQGLRGATYEFRVSFENSYYKGSKEQALTAFAGITDIETVLDSIEDQINAVDAFSQAARLMTEVKRRIEDLRRKQERAELKRADHEREALKLLQGEITVAAETDIRECEKLAREENDKISKWDTAINKLEGTVRSLKEALQQGDYDAAAKCLKIMQTTGGSYLPPPSVRPVLDGILKKAAGKIEYIAHYPTITEESLSPSTNVTEETRKNRRLIQWMFAGSVVLGAVSAVTLISEHRGEEGAKNHSALTAKSHDTADVKTPEDLIMKSTHDRRLKLTKVRVYKYLVTKEVKEDQAAEIVMNSHSQEELFQRSFNLVRQLDAKIAMQEVNGQRVTSIPHIVVTPHSDLKGLSYQVFGEAKNSLVSKGLVVHGSTDEGDAVLDRNQFCLTRNNTLSVTVDYDLRHSGPEIERTIGDGERRRICGLVRAELVKEFGEEKVKEEEAKKSQALLLMEQMKGKSLDEARQEARGFIAVMQKEGKISKKVTLNRVNTATRYEDLEVALIEAFEGDIYETEITMQKGHKSIMFRPRSDLLDGMRAIYGPFVNAGIAHTLNMAKAPENQPPIQSGHGLWLTEFCAHEKYDQYRFVVQPKPDGPFTAHNVDMGRYREKYCK